MAGTNNSIDPNLIKERSVFLALRVIELHSKAVFLVKETRHNKWFIPGGKVQPGENDYVAMVRELKEETGLVIPNKYRLTKYKTFEQTGDSHVPVDVVLFVADVPYSFLFGEKAFLDRDSARDLGETLSAIRFANASNPDANPIPKVMASPLHSNFEIEVSDGGIREPAWHCFSFGELAPLQDILPRVEVDAFDTDYKGFGFRYNMTESKLWGEVFSVLNNPKSAEELYQETAPAVVPVPRAHDHAVPADLLKRQPRFESIKGEGDLERTLFPEITRVRNSITNPLSGYSGMSGRAQVTYIAELFSGKLAEWWNKLTANSANDPSVIPDSVDDLVVKIKTSYCIRDYEVEHLTKLMSLKQTSNNAQGMQSYITEYNRYMSTWSHLMEWKLQAYWFILGLESSNIRSDLFARVKSGDFDKYPENSRLAQLLNTAATCALNRSDGASGSGSKRLPASGSNSEEGGSKNGGKPYKKKQKFNGNGNGKGGKQPKGKANQAKKSDMMNSQIYKDTLAKLRDNMSKDEFDKHCKEGLCLYCHKSGHKLWECRNCPEFRK